MGEREQLIAAVRSRLERVAIMRDLSPVLEEMAITEARELTQIIADDPESEPAKYLLGWLFWYRFLGLPEDRRERDLEVAVSIFASCFIDGITDVPEPLLPILADQAIPTAIERLRLTQVSDDKELLSSTTDLWQRILTATPADHPGRAGRLSSLGMALETRFRRTGGTGDLDAAIEAGQEAVRATPADHPDRAVYLSNLGAALEIRFERAGAAEDLDAAVAHLREAVRAVSSDHPSRRVYLSNLGAVLRVRFEGTGAAEDLDAAIEAGQEAVQATPANDPGRAMGLSNLGTALVTRFERTGATKDLDAAIEARNPVIPARGLARAVFLRRRRLAPTAQA